MKNFKIGMFLIVVATFQFFILLFFGYINEGSDINAASMYRVVYWMPAIFYNGVNGLLQFFFKPKRISALCMLLVFPAVAAVIMTEAKNALGKNLYYIVIAASILINTGYYFIIQKNSKTNNI